MPEDTTRKIISPSHLVWNCQNKWRTHSLPRSQRRHFICSLINLPQLDNPSCLGAKIIGIFLMNSFSLPHSRSIQRLSSFISRRGSEQKQSILFFVLSDEIIGAPSLQSAAGCLLTERRQEEKNLDVTGSESTEETRFTPSDIADNKSSPHFTLSASASH